MPAGLGDAGKIVIVTGSEIQATPPSWVNGSLSYRRFFWIFIAVHVSVGYSLH